MLNTGDFIYTIFVRVVHEKEYTEKGNVSFQSFLQKQREKTD